MADALPALPANPVVMNLQPVYGVALIGVLFSSALWGISCMQLFLYLLNYETDSLALKAFVLATWIIDTATQVLTAQAMWPTLITNWGSTEYLFAIPPTFIHRTWVTSISTVGAQLFFVSRIYRFTEKHKLFIPLLLAPFILWELAGAIMFAAYAFALHDNFLKKLSFDARVYASTISIRATSAFVDVTIAAAMVYLLAKRKNPALTLSGSTKKLISRSIVLTINTGLWTAILALIDLIMITAIPDGLQFCILELPLASLYVNSLLASLNARVYLRSEGTSANFIEMEFRSNGSQGVTTLEAGRSRRGPQLSTKRTVEIHVERSINKDIPGSEDDLKGVPMSDPLPGGGIPEKYDAM